jgi:hypothetical protein
MLRRLIFHAALLGAQVKGGVSLMCALLGAVEKDCGPNVGPKLFALAFSTATFI